MTCLLSAVRQLATENLRATEIFATLAFGRESEMPHYAFDGAGSGIRKGSLSASQKTSLGLSPLQSRSTDGSGFSQADCDARCL